MKTIINVLLLGTMFFIMHKFLHIDILKSSKKAVDTSFGFVGNVNSRMHKKNEQKAKLSKSKSLANSKLYILIEGIILDNNFKDVTVEGLITTISFASIIINGILFFMLKSVLVFIVGFLGVLVFLLTLLFMTGSETYYTRQYGRMDAEDLITSSLKNGIISAVKDNIELIPEVVRKPYDDFLRLISMESSIEVALETLGKDLGRESLPYVNQLKTFDKFERKGSLDIFRDISKENANTRMDMMDIQMFLRDLNSAYLKTLGVTGILLVFMILPNPVMLDLLLYTTLGNIAILINFCIVVFGFARIQKFRN